jgi:hypothetical protein
VALDYEHNTVPGTAEYERTKEPRDIGGTCNLVCVPGVGIFGEAITYTATGTTAANNYEDVSLAPYLDKERRVIAAHSVALTRAGAAYGIHFQPADPAKLSASEAQLGAELQILSAAASAVVEHTTPMPEKFLSLALVATLVGLSAEADEASVTAKLKERLAPPAAPDLTPLSARLDKLEALKPVDYSQRITALEEALADGAKAATEGERNRLVTLFASDGKAPINPDTGKAYTADELQKLDMPVLKVLHANTPVTVPLSARTTRLSDGARQVDPNLKGRDRVIAAFSNQSASRQ